MKSGEELKGVIKCIKGKKDPRSRKIHLRLEKVGDKSINVDQIYFLS